MGSLLVGVSFAKGLARSLNIPMIDVNHLQGHVLAHFIKNQKKMLITQIPVLFAYWFPVEFADYPCECVQRYAGFGTDY